MHTTTPKTSQDAMSSLTQEEQSVLRLRFGLSEDTDQELIDTLIPPTSGGDDNGGSGGVPAVSVAPPGSNPCK